MSLARARTFPRHGAHGAAHGATGPRARSVGCRSDPPVVAPGGDTRRHKGGAMREGLIAVAIAGAAIAGAGLRSPAHAQEPDVYELGEIVVSADRPVTERVATHHVVSAEEIRASGARTLDEALLLLPGLDIRTGGQGVPRINLRGMRPRHVILLLDGIPMNTTFDGQADPAFIPVENIAMIKLIPASGSVLYGAGGLGGVINIVTRRDGSRFSAEATGEAREGTTFAGCARASGGGERLSYLASASWMDSDGFPSISASPSVGGGTREVRENSNRRRFSAFGSLTLEPTQHSTVGLELSRTEGVYGIPPGLIDDPDDPFARRPTHERVEDAAGTSVQLAGRLNPAGPLRYRAWTFFNRWDQVSARYDDDTYTSMDDPTVNGTYHEESRSTTVGAAFQTIFEPSARARLTLALSAERAGWESDL